MYGLFFGTTGGDIHLLYLPSFFSENPPDSGWGSGDDVVGTFKSKEFNFGDWSALKTIRKIYVSMSGTVVNVTLNTLDNTGEVSDVALEVSTLLPKTINATPDISSVPRRIRGASIEISGVDLVLESLDFLWKQIRLE